MAEVKEPQMVPIDQFEPVDWNPNVEDLGTFNELVAQIEEQGYTDPVECVKEGDVFKIIGGEHRWKAARQAGLTEIPAIVRDWDEDEQKIQNIRLNQFKGRMDPEKFTDVWNELREKYDRDALMRKLGFGHKEKELERLVGKARESIPKDMQEEFDKRAEKIQSVEDLASVVQAIYSRSGQTLKDTGYMFLTYGGETHLMIRMSVDTRKKLKATLNAMAENGQHADQLAADIVKELADASRPDSD